VPLYSFLQIYLLFEDKPALHNLSAMHSRQEEENKEEVRSILGAAYLVSLKQIAQKADAEGNQKKRSNKHQHKFAAGRIDDS